MLLTPANRPEMDIVRHIATMDRSMLGGHCEVAFTDLFIADDDVLGEVDEGFRYAQVRLGPARMTHVIRFSCWSRRQENLRVLAEACTGRPVFRHGYSLDRDRSDLRTRASAEVSSPPGFVALSSFDNRTVSC
jgi:hypothetical protein